MSEYQFYEFQAIDRPLKSAELDEIRKISSRVNLTASSAVFVYNYGDFRGDPAKVLAQYYDAMLYLSTWGSRLIFRFPAAAVDWAAMKRYAVADLIELSKEGEYVVLDLHPYSEEPSGRWLEGEGMLAQMVSLRSDIIAGDYRALYILWLAGIWLSIHVEEDLEPPVPDGMQSFEDAHLKLIEFFEIDKDLVDVASLASQPLVPVYALDLRSGLAQLSQAEKDDFLLRLADDEPGLHHILRKRLQANSGKTQVVKQQPRRSAGTLLELGEKATETRIERENAEKEKARVLKLSTITQNSDALWREAYAIINRRKADDYDKAVKILLELKAAAAHAKAHTDFDRQLAQLCKEFKSLVGLRSRMQSAGLSIES